MQESYDATCIFPSPTTSTTRMLISCTRMSCMLILRENNCPLQVFPRDLFFFLLFLLKRFTVLFSNVERMQLYFIYADKIDIKICWIFLWCLADLYILQLQNKKAKCIRIYVYVHTMICAYMYIDTVAYFGKKSINSNCCFTILKGYNLLSLVNILIHIVWYSIPNNTS